MWFCLTRPEEVTNIYLSCFVELFSALHVSCWDRKQPDGFWEFPFGRVLWCWLVLPLGHGPKGRCPLCPPPQPLASPVGSFPQPSITCRRGQCHQPGPPPAALAARGVSSSRTDFSLGFHLKLRNNQVHWFLQASLFTAFLDYVDGWNRGLDAFAASPHVCFRIIETLGLEKT